MSVLTSLLTSDILINFLVFFLGSMLGSFVAAVSYRIPLNQDIATKRSSCPKCNHVLSALDLIPIFSFLFLQGKCRYCNQEISKRYVIIEITQGFLFLLIYNRFGFEINTLFLFAIAVLLLVHFITDIEHYYLNDNVSIALAITLIAYSFFNPAIHLVEGLILASLTLILLITIKFILTKILKKEVMGSGDLKLLPICSFYIGYGNIGIFILLCGLLSLIFSLVWKQYKKVDYAPFGPIIVLTFFAFLLLNNQNLWQI